MKKVLIFGIDGGNLITLKPWIDSGDMPFLAEFLARNYHTDIPCEIDTALGWPTFATGKLPNNHMCYYWMGRNSQSRQDNFMVNSDFIGDETLWDALGSAGIKSCVVCQPFTYPPKPINGWLLSGPGGGLNPTADFQFSHPLSLKQELVDAGINYEIKWGGFSSYKNPVEYVNTITDTTNNHIKAAKFIQNKYSPDCLTIIFRGNDALQHYACDLILSGRLKQDKQLLNSIRELFQLIDNGMKELYEQASSTTDDLSVLLVSDHGFGPCNLKVNLDEAFRTHGLLHYKYSPLVDRPLRMLGFNRTSHSVLKWLNMSKSKAYRDSTNSVSLNVRGRDPEGIVDESQYLTLRNDIIDLMRSMHHPEFGPIFERVVTPEEIGLGDHKLEKYIPDILFDPMPGIHIDGGLRPLEFHKTFVPMSNKGFVNWTGCHRKDGIFSVENVLTSEESKNLDKQYNLTQIAPTVCKLFNVPIPEWMDGEPIH